MVGAIQTFGQLIHADPHIHALVTVGVFLADLSAPARRQAGGCGTHRQAALIRQVYESHPLRCPKCDTTMRIIAFTCLPAGRSSGVRPR